MNSSQDGYGYWISWVGRKNIFAGRCVVTGPTSLNISHEKERLKKGGRREGEKSPGDGLSEWVGWASEWQIDSNQTGDWQYGGGLTACHSAGRSQHPVLPTTVRVDPCPIHRQKANQPPISSHLPLSFSLSLSRIDDHFSGNNHRQHQLAPVLLLIISISISIPFPLTSIFLFPSYDRSKQISSPWGLKRKGIGKSVLKDINLELA